MRYFQVRYNSRVVIYDCKMFMRLATEQSYKASTIIIYDSRVVPDLKIPHILTQES